MERLTSYKKECNREMICRYEDCDTCEEYCPHLNEDNCPCLQEVLERLAEYEDLEEQGKLLKLPCTVGDWVYVIKKNGDIDLHKVVLIEINEDGAYFKSSYRFGKLEDFGKTIFFDKEEAEAALKEL